VSAASFDEAHVLRLTAGEAALSQNDTRCPSRLIGRDGVQEVQLRAGRLRQRQCALEGGVSAVRKIQRDEYSIVFQWIRSHMAKRANPWPGSTTRKPPEIN
jgi:hypothetical protein